MALDPVYRRYNHQSDHLLVHVRLVGEFHTADLPRRGGARQALAARQDAGRRLAEAREPAPVLAYMCAHPGKKLLFMGCEFGQWQEWRDYEQIDWQQMQDPAHPALRDCVRELNHLYLRPPAAARQRLRSRRASAGWICTMPDESVWAFQRRCTGAGAARTHRCACSTRRRCRATAMRSAVTDPGTIPQDIRFRRRAVRRLGIQRPGRGERPRPDRGTAICIR